VWRLRLELWHLKNWLLHHNTTIISYFLFHQEMFDKNTWLSLPIHPIFLWKATIFTQLMWTR
jgi:hypothetical protein